MMDEDDYLAIQEACAYSYAAICDAIGLCKKYRDKKKHQMRVKLEEAKAKMETIIEKCQEYTHQENGFSAPSFLNDKLKKDDYIDAIRLYYDFDFEDLEAGETDEEVEEWKFFQCLGAIKFAAVSPLEEYYDFSPDDDEDAIIEELHLLYEFIDGI